MIAVALITATAAAYWFMRPNRPDSAMAWEILHHCLDGPDERCLIEDDTKVDDLRALKFKLVGTHDSTAMAVAAYEFRSEDRRYCAYVELGKRGMDWHRTAQFYQCINSSVVHLGLG
ncbi:hypothetical protein [Sphingopyxis witflariensis]|nr:hypothetical protein [Sphingopyxis witflariensis]